jgi:hypothetical protein
MYGTWELGVYGVFGSLDFRILLVPPETKILGLYDDDDIIIMVPLCLYPCIFGFLWCLSLPGTSGIRRSRGAKNNRVLGVYASRMVFQV